MSCKLVFLIFFFFTWSLCSRKAVSSSCHPDTGTSVYCTWSHWNKAWNGGKKNKQTNQKIAVRYGGETTSSTMLSYTRILSHINVCLENLWNNKSTQTSGVWFMRCPRYDSWRKYFTKLVSTFTLFPVQTYWMDPSIVFSFAISLRR